jgi:hypothetical protein
MAALAVVPLGATAGAGNVVRFDSTVVLRDSFPAFHGRVKSENDACEENRRVKMFRKRSGPDEVLGTDETNSQGRWKVIVDPLSSGAYYAKVKRREEGAAGTIFVCKSDKSPLVVVD